MNPARIGTACVLLAMISSCAAAGPREQLSFWPARVELTGVITERTFPGPPEYADIKKGDKPERVWIMHLDRPTSVRPAPEDRENSEVKDARDVTVYFYDRYKDCHWERLLGKHVRVKGVLFSAINAHQRTDISIRADDISAR